MGREEIINALHRFDENGSFWWDKWHSSPYYVSHLAAYALEGIADDIRASRLKWIMRTQNDDGGWAISASRRLKKQLMR